MQTCVLHCACALASALACGHQKFIKLFHYFFIFALEHNLINILVPSNIVLLRFFWCACSFFNPLMSTIVCFLIFLFSRLTCFLWISLKGTIIFNISAIVEHYIQIGLHTQKHVQTFRCRYMYVSKCPHLWNMYRQGVWVTFETIEIKIGLSL